MPLVDFHTLMSDAAKWCYAVGYFESWNLESLLAVADAAESMRSPVILGFSGIYLSHPDRVVHDPLAAYAAMGLEVCRGLSVPACLLFNESPNFDWVLDALRLGFGMVMYSNDELAPAERIERIAHLAGLAHRNHQSVEAEMFALPGVGGDEISSDLAAPMTDPDVAARFVQQTAIDALAVNVGQAHLHGRAPARLDLKRLAAIRDVVDIPLVLHGGTSLDRGDLSEAIEIGIRKINVGSALKQAYSQALHDACKDSTRAGNPYEVIGSGLAIDAVVPARLALQRMVEQWMKLLGSAGHAE